MSTLSRYAAQQVALLTRHGKQAVIAPVLEAGLGCSVVHVDSFDTDTLGTFTRETPRAGTQLEAARTKARKGMELTGLGMALASEGSFGPDPFAGLFTWDVEVLLWLDDTLGIEVTGIAQGPARSGHLKTGEFDALEAFAVHEGFPDHHLVLRPEHEDDPRTYKGIADSQTLREAFEACRALAANGQVCAETDMRAFANPTRMALIAEAAEDLLLRLHSCCPQCSTPGYWKTARQPGLPCAVCGRPTRNFVSETWSCVKCSHASIELRRDRMSEDPANCAHCNP
jgi:hypothetical protein